MSDQELVTFNSTQFQRLDLHLEKIGNALWEINDKLKPIDNSIDKNTLEITKWLAALAEAVGGGGNAETNQKLDAIIQLLQVQNGVPAELGLIKAKLDLIHELVQDGGDSTGVQAKIDESTQEMKSSTDALDAAVKAQQPK